MDRATNIYKYGQHNSIVFWRLAVGFALLTSIARVAVIVYNSTLYIKRLSKVLRTTVEQPVGISAARKRRNGADPLPDYLAKV